MIHELLHIVWPDGVPPRWEPLVDRDLCASLLREFKLGVILSMGPGPGGIEARPPRLALSDQGERGEWERGVLDQWPSDEAARFLGLVPPGTRRMADSDGSERVVLYLDDLQAARHSLEPPDHLGQEELMCATLALPGHERGWLTRHTEPPLCLIHGPLLQRARSLLALGATGLWSLRWQGATVTGLLWITESRWRENADATGELVGRLIHAEGAEAGLAETLGIIRENVASRGHRAYPDAVELTSAGGMDLTLGFL